MIYRVKVLLFFVVTAAAADLLLSVGLSWLLVSTSQLAAGFDFCRRDLFVSSSSSLFFRNTSVHTTQIVRQSVSLSVGLFIFFGGYNFSYPPIEMPLWLVTEEGYHHRCSPTQSALRHNHNNHFNCFFVLFSFVFSYVLNCVIVCMFLFSFFVVSLCECVCVRTFWLD